MIHCGAASAVAAPLAVSSGGTGVTALTGFLARSYLAGLTLSTAGSSATMAIAAGQAADGTNAAFMALAASISKTTGAWAVGSAQGGLDTGAIANSTWYHFWLIQRVDTGVVDVLISLSATAPTMPTNYTLKRRIGSGLTNGSAQWVSFSQLGDEFLWATPVNDVNTATQAASATSYTLSTPTGVQTIARIRGYIGGTGTNTPVVLINALDETSTAPNTPTGNNTLIGQVNTANPAFTLDVRTSTASQIRANSSAGSTTLAITTYGWIDRRGRDN